MDSETSTGHYVDLLERVLLDRNAEATHVPLSLLEHITNSFSNDRQIGSGGFAVVYKGIVGKGLVAVKKLSKTYNLPEGKFHKEVECLMKAKHKNIVRFLGYCSETHGRIADNEGKFVMADIRNWLLCFEYVPNGSLDKYIADASRGLEWRERYVIIKGMCEGLHHLHEKHILHLDLKPGNILVDDHMVPKIADFGLSRCLDKDQSQAFTSNICGSLGYMAPEFLRGQVSFASDIYSLGVIIVEIMTGAKEYPENENVVQIWMNRLEKSDQWKTQLEQVGVCIKIGIECMDSNPKKRPVARHINDRLDKIASIIETGIGSLSIEQEISFLKEQFLEEERARYLEEERANFIFSFHRAKECAETEDLADYTETPREDHRHQEASGNQWPLCAVLKQKFSPQGENISSSNSGVLYKVENMDLFGRKAQHRFHMMNTIPRLSRTNNIVSVKNFKYMELKTFLKYNNLIGKGGFGKVYRGLVDGEQVVVRRLIDGTTTRDFANEVTIQGQIIHKNIVTLLGCCLEVYNRMLVYEFLSRGSLHDILHNNIVPLNLDLRLSIAAESSKGLAYMHSEAGITIIHGDVRPANILLDDNFVPKISNVGRSRLIVRGYGHSKPTIGDMAYMDPVFLQTGLLTEKSDVYSFGVVMLELLTRKKATHDENNSLVRNFIENHLMGRKATELFDKEIAVTGDSEVLDKLVEIAVQCLNLDVQLRPTMMDVRDHLCALNLHQSPRTVS